MLKVKSTVSVVMSCLNEEKTIGLCVQRAKIGLKKAGLKGEVIVSDNGSTDNSIKIAKSLEAKVVQEPRKGYGSAYLKGFKTAKDDWMVVLGSRLKGKIKPGSMPFLNRYFGKPCLNLFIRIFLHLNISDSQSGMRAFPKKTYNK